MMVLVECLSPEMYVEEEEECPFSAAGFEELSVVDHAVDQLEGPEEGHEVDHEVDQMEDLTGDLEDLEEDLLRLGEESS